MNKGSKKIISFLTAAFFSAAFLCSCGLSSVTEQETSSAENDNVLTIGVIVPDTGEYSYYSLGTELILRAVSESYHEETGQYLKYYISEDYSGDASEADEIVSEFYELGVSVIVTAHGSENTEAVSAACERLGIFCVAADTDAEGWKDTGPYESCLCVSYSTRARLEALASSWNSVSDAPVVGLLLAQGSDSDDILDIYDDLAYDYNATIIDPGRFSEGQTDYSAMISAFITSGCEIVSGIMDADDLLMFLTQAAEAEYYPEVIAVADGLLFENDVLSAGSLADGLYTDIVFDASSGVSGGYLMTGSVLEELFGTEYNLSAPQSAALFTAALETALYAAANSSAADGTELASFASSNTVSTVIGEISFDEDGVCLASVSLGVWYYDEESGTCRLETVN